MAIDFPASPSTNDTFTAGSITYKWDGAKWIGLGVTPADRLIEGSNSLEINANNDLVWTGDSVLLGTATANTSDKLTIHDPGSAFVSIRSDVASDGNSQVLDFGVGTADRSSSNLTAVIAADIHSTSGGTLKADLVFQTNAGNNISDKMRLTSDGDLGIGEDSPADRLVVQKTNASGDVAVRIKNDTTTDGDATNPTSASLYLTTSTGDFNTFYIQARRNDNDTHFGYADPRDANHVPTMVLTNEKQVLIGTSSLIDTSVASNFQIASASGPRLCIARNDTDTDDGNLIGALDFYGNHTATAGGYELIGRMLCEADENHSDSSKASRLSFYTCTSGSDAAVEKMRLNAAGELLIGETNSPLDDSITGATACKIGMSFGNSIGNYIEMGGTNRTANGLNKLATMRHGYWGGAREVGSLGFLTSSSSGGAGRGSANFVIHTGTSGNGDGGVSGDTLSIERVRVDSGGALYVNTTSNSNWGQTSNSLNTDNSNTNDISGNMCFRSYSGALVIANDADAGYAGIYINKFDWSGSDDNRWISFYLNGALKDSITWNGSNVVYGTNSDYRIKTNIRDFTGGIDLVKQLPVRLYDYIETERGTDHVGFIAHELQEIIPEAVSGEKDGMRAEEDTGNEVMNIQNVEYGKVTPLLTAALKEAIAKIETLEARITALEG